MKGLIECLQKGGSNFAKNFLHTTVSFLGDSDAYCLMRTCTFIHHQLYSIVGNSVEVSYDSWQNLNVLRFLIDDHIMHWRFNDQMPYAVEDRSKTMEYIHFFIQNNMMNMYSLFCFALIQDSIEAAEFVRMYAEKYSHLNGEIGDLVYALDVRSGEMVRYLSQHKIRVDWGTVDSCPGEYWMFQYWCESWNDESDMNRLSLHLLDHDHNFCDIVSHCCNFYDIHGWLRVFIILLNKFAIQHGLKITSEQCRKLRCSEFHDESCLCEKDQVKYSCDWLLERHPLKRFKQE